MDTVELHENIYHFEMISLGMFGQNSTRSPLHESLEVDRRGAMDGRLSVWGNAGENELIQQVNPLGCSVEFELDSVKFV